MRRTDLRPAPADTVVELRGDVADELAVYARTKVRHVLARTGLPVLRTRVRVTRHSDPARSRPVVAQAAVDLNGRPLHVQVEATAPHEAVDLLVDRLAHRLARAARGWEARRGRMDEAVPHEWRHDFPPTPRGRSYPRPPAERRVVRHRSMSPLPCTVDEAVAEMADLGHRFHLFVESSRGIDSVVHRDGPTGLRLAQLDGRAGEVAPGAVPVVADALPAPLLDLAGDVDRLELTGLPFLFFLDGEHARGCVLYRRYDGHHGLVDPTVEATFPGPP